MRIIFTLILLFNLVNARTQPVAAPANPIPDANAVSIDVMSAYIRQNFGSDTARVRAIYNWITTHVSYDVQRFLARDRNDPTIPPPTAAEVLQSRTAVCQGYADLFVALCAGAGIEAVMIGGYGKQMGKISDVGHAWVGAKLNNEWYLFDPTWGAGTVRNDVFIKRYTDRFYKVMPAKFIEDHMPTDPMFQLLSYPVTPTEFKEGRPAAGKNLFKFSDSILVYNRLSKIAQARAELARMEAAGISNKVLQDRGNFLKNVINASASKDAFMEAQKSYKYSFDLYKVFMDLKRAQFAGTPDDDVRSRVDSIEFYIKQARLTLQDAEPKTDAHRTAKAGLTGAIDKFWTEVVKQKDFVVKFIATDKGKRKQLFMR